MSGPRLIRILREEVSFRIGVMEVSLTFYELLIHAALIVWTLLGLGALIGMVVITPQILRTMREVDDMADIVKHRALPVLEHTEEVLDQFSRISTTLADDFEIVDQTIIRAAESVERMVELTEDRVVEVNALLSVAIEEAEDTFISFGGLVRAFTPGRRRRRRRWLPSEIRRRFG